jgi:hypothetical protein
MPVLGAPRQFAFIPAALPLAAPLAAPAAAAATATAVGVADLVLAGMQLAWITLAGALVITNRFQRDQGSSVWGYLSSRPGKPAINPPGVPIYPTGDYNPAGGNVWSWSVTGTQWGPNPNPTPNVTKTFTWQGGAGRYAWLVLTDPKMSHNGVLEYDDAQVHEGPALGVDGGNGLMGFLRCGGFMVDAKFAADVRPVSGTGVPLPQPGVAFPDGWHPPQVAPLPLPVKPGIKPTVAPGVSPGTLPEAQPSPVPVAPGVVAPPMVGTGIPPKAVPPVPATATPTATGPDGRPLPKPGPLVPTTPQDVHFPGGIPITSNPPQPTLQGIAAEVGRIENKLARLFAPPGGDGFDWAEKLRELWDIINSRYEAGYYDLWAPCDKGPTGEFLHEKFEWDAGFSEFGSLRVRLDAIAQMLQRQKDWKQPICEPEIPANNGRAINVQFRSTVASPNGEKPLRKVFGYRDPSGKELIEHRDHWVGFEFESGPWMVISKGAYWGNVKVWASSEAEGRRVIEHAAAIAGVDLQGHEHRWIAREVMDPRYGVRLRMSVRRDTMGHVWVTERTGPNGLPVVAVPLAPDINVDP